MPSIVSSSLSELQKRKLEPPSLDSLGWDGSNAPRERRSTQRAADMTLEDVEEGPEDVQKSK